MIKILYIIIPAILVYALYRVFRKTGNKTVHRVEFDGIKVKSFHRNGKIEEVDFKDLEYVLIETTSGGPFVEDLFWILSGKDNESGCVYPGSADGAMELLTYMQENLDGFDNKAVIEASGSIEDNRFLVWVSETKKRELKMDNN